MRKTVYFLALILVFGSAPLVGNQSPAGNSEAVYTEAVYNEANATLSDYVLTNSGIKIIYPLFSTPAIVRKGGNFSIMVSFDGAPEQWECEISTAYDIVCEDYFLAVEDEEYNPTSGLWILNVTVPSNVNEDLYNITVVAYSDGDKYQADEPKSVSVVNEFKNNFSFVHLTDFHIGDPRGMTVDVRKTIGWKAARKSVEEINLLNPDFVIITGDLVFGQLYPFEYSVEYRKCYKILQQFDVPTFLCPGNHDGYIQTGQDGFRLWEKFIGPLYYSFNYGDYHFTSVNSYDWPAPSRWAISYAPLQWGGHIREEQMKWIEKDLEHSTNAKARFIMLHHNPLWDTKNDSLLKNGNYTGREELLSLIEKYNVSAVFDGHVHYDNVTEQNGTLYITTTTCASELSAEDAYWGYRLIEVEDGKIVSYNYKEPKYSIPLYRLNCTYSENDGSASTVSAEIENDLEMNVEATLHFYVPPGDYEVDNGEIIREAEANGIERVDVSTSIPPTTSMEVVIHPS